MKRIGYSVAMMTLAALLGAGCGDDTSATAGGIDMSAAQDLAGGGGNAPTCAQYCAKVTMSCSAGGDAGGFEQYPSEAACNAYCTTVAAWPAGKATDLTGNTIGCRLYHAGAAAADPATHCPHAGPTGGNVCGSWCENYCQLMAKNCTGANAVYDATTCMTKCMTIPTSGMVNDTTGNTVQCRIYHLGEAAADPVTHCPHAKTIQDFPNGPCT